MLRGNRFQGYRCSRCRAPFSARFVAQLRHDAIKVLLQRHFSDVPGTTPQRSGQDRRAGTDADAAVLRRERAALKRLPPIHIEHSEVNIEDDGTIARAIAEARAARGHAAPEGRDPLPSPSQLATTDEEDYIDLTPHGVTEAQATFASQARTEPSQQPSAVLTPSGMGTQEGKPQGAVGSTAKPAVATATGTTAAAASARSAHGFKLKQARYIFVERGGKKVPVLVQQRASAPAAARTPPSRAKATRTAAPKKARLAKRKR